MFDYDEIRLELGSFKKDLDDLADALNITFLEKKAKELSIISSEPDFWNDMGNSSKILQELKAYENKINEYKSLYKLFDDTLELACLASDENDLSFLDEIKSSTEKFKFELERMRLTTLLTGEYDKNNAILTFHAGAGGTESQDWAEMLFRMYNRWGERHGFKVTTLYYLDGDEAGLKSATILIEGENAYGYMKSEGGIHRLVRISPFDSAGRRHTSFAAVEAMPEITDDAAIDIRADDLRVDTYRSGGAGGQHVNKTDSAIRITHLPTGIVVQCQNERSQHQNRDVAMRMLKSKLVEIKEKEHLEKIDDIKGIHKEITWGSQIRSYVFMPYTLAKDHRTSFENGNISAVMDGDIDGFINAYLKMNAREK